MPDEARYRALAHGIALLIWLRCVDQGDGAPLFEHFNENGFDAPADMLTRLGLMEERRRGEHAFTTRWRPGAPPSVTRTATSPTVFDLILGLLFLLNWDKAEAPRQADAPSAMPPLPDLSDDRRFMGAGQIRFHRYAIKVAADALAAFGLCRWDQDGALQIAPAPEGGEMDDLLGLYDFTSWAMRQPDAPN